MVLPTNISIRLTCNVQLLSMLQATHSLTQQQQTHLRLLLLLDHRLILDDLCLMLTLIHRLILPTDWSMLETPWKRKITSPLAAPRCVCHRSYWRGYRHLCLHFIPFCIPVIRSYRTTVLPHILQHLVAHIRGENGWGVFYSRNPCKIFGSKMTQQESGENGTISVGDRIILKETL